MANMAKAKKIRKIKEYVAAATIVGVFFTFWFCFNLTEVRALSDDETESKMDVYEVAEASVVQPDMHGGDIVEETITIDQLKTDLAPCSVKQGKMEVPMFLYGDSDIVSVPKNIGQTYYKEMVELTSYLYKHPDGLLHYTAYPLYDADGNAVALYIYMKSEDGAFECSKIIGE